MKFKISNHKLMIELGRYISERSYTQGKQIMPIVQIKSSGELMNLISCSRHSFQRETFLDRVNEITPDFERKSTSESIKLLMNSNDHHVNKLVMKFISSCTDIRDTLLLSNESDVT